MVSPLKLTCCSGAVFFPGLRRIACCPVRSDASEADEEEDGDVDTEDGAREGDGSTEGSTEGSTDGSPQSSPGPDPDPPKKPTGGARVADGKGGPERRGRRRGARPRAQTCPSDIAATSRTVSFVGERMDITQVSAEPLAERGLGFTPGAVGARGISATILVDLSGVVILAGGPLAAIFMGGPPRAPEAGMSINVTWQRGGLRVFMLLFEAARAGKQAQTALRVDGVDFQALACGVGHRTGRVLPELGRPPGGRPPRPGPLAVVITLIRRPPTASLIHSHAPRAL